MTERNKLSNRFIEAFQYTAQLHSDQFRKGTKIPYLAHLMGVASLVLEASCEEEVAIAALLHDAVEDQGGLETLREIEKRFGKRVAQIVKDCSDTCTDPKPPWRKRKEIYLTHLTDASPEARLVSLADKLYNARSIHKELLENGTQILQKFKGGKSGIVWYYESLVAVFQKTETNYMTQELLQVVQDIKSISENEKTTDNETSKYE